MASQSMLRLLRLFWQLQGNALYSLFLIIRYSSEVVVALKMLLIRRRRTGEPQTKQFAPPVCCTKQTLR